MILWPQIKCTRCQGKSERQERMMDLTVEIEGDIGTLEEALRRFTGTEILDGENKYQCSRLVVFLKALESIYFLYVIHFVSQKKIKLYVKFADEAMTSKSFWQCIG